MRLDIRVIQHKRQRYGTCGDYYSKGGVWFFRVSKMKNRRHCWLILIHEFIEWGLCQLTGIRNRDITRFDKAYEGARALGVAHALCGCRLKDEPGDDIHAPYWEAHQVATECERIIAKALNVDWLEYGEAVDGLS